MTDERIDLRGQVLDGEYRLGASIGVGGTSVVLDATRLSDGHQVVVKVLRPQFAHHADLERRLRREAEVYESVRHPGIVPVLDHGILGDGTPYLVMERMHSESLLRLMRRRGVLTAGEAGVLMARVASILHAVHQSGYVHRDIKPEHILLDRLRDGSLHVSLLDWGVCAAETAPQAERERERGRVYGTPSYVSPEQAGGQPNVDGRADLFGLGSTFFEALTGELPFAGSTVGNLLRRILLEDAPRVSTLRADIPAWLDDLVASIMQRDPACRPSSARAMGRTLLQHVPNRAQIERELASVLEVGESDTARTPTREIEIVAA
jgi:serine/threonine protein kinase